MPVRLLFNDPALNLRADYSLFDRDTGRPVCVGNGESCRRVGNEGVEGLACPGPDTCRFADGQCKAYARFNVVIGDSQDDTLGSFVLRTTSFNTIRTLAARLQYFSAVSGGRLACMPQELKLRGKSTTMSYRTAIYYVDMVVRSGLSLEQVIEVARELEQVIEVARELDQHRQASGFDQVALDEAARKGFANGAFEELEEDVPAMVEEFFTEEDAEHPPAQAVTELRGKLEAKVARMP